MVFSSVTFLFFFLPLFLLVYFGLRPKNAVLLGASLLFYAWGELGYVGLLLASIAVNYLAGLWIDAAASTSRGSRWALFAGVTANLLLLGAFKYADFALESLAAITGNAELRLTPMHYPIGLSFFTFQAISYLIDVHRQRIPAERSPLVLATYISMFPQLVAGPIVRFAAVRDELHGRRVDLAGFELGLRRFVIGLGQKMLLANVLATAVDPIFGIAPGHLTASLTWLAAVGYTLQIYFDFAGYSNMAIGLGCMLGFRFPENFDHPYIAQSITEFWRRWHITLSTWFRDYLYIPLGGNRLGPLRTYRNLAIVFVLCGLWHGAAWTFVVWGLYHGAFLVLERAGFGAVLARAWRPLRHAYLLLVVVAGFTIFRAETLAHAGAFLSAMAGLGAGSGIDYHTGLYLRPNVVIAGAVAAIASMPVVPWVTRRFDRLPDAPGAVPMRTAALAGLAAVILLSSMSLAAGTHNPFIYFRF